MDPFPSALIDSLRDASTSVPDLSGQFDHSSRRLVAQGGYSTVYTTDWKPPDSKIPVKVCYKELRPRVSDMPEVMMKTKKTIKHLRHEMKIWGTLKHPNILEFLGFAIEVEGPDVKGILISVWCPNGNVEEYLKNNVASDRIALSRDVAKGLEHLHHLSLPIVHGDLKPVNVLVGDDCQAMLCDFGLSRITSELSTDQTSSVMGATPRFTAPEVISGDAKKSMKSDIYSFACTCIKILFDKYPYPGYPQQNSQRLIMAINKGEPPWEWREDDPLERILSSCCSPSARDRPSIGKVLKVISSPGLQPPTRLKTSPRTSLRKGETLLVESITVPSRAVGRIMGKGGASIQSIRQETGAQISIADDQPPDAMVEIRGTLDAVSAAKNTIMAISAEVTSEKAIIMIIDPKYHGFILGKDGQILKDIISRAQGPSHGRLIVQFPPRDGPPSSEVRLEGPEPALAEITKAFNEIIARYSNVFGTIIPASLHGRIIGFKGENLKTILNRHDVDIQFPGSPRYEFLGDVNNVDAMEGAALGDVVKVRGTEVGCALAIKELKTYGRSRSDSPTSTVAVKGDDSEADSDV